MVSKGITFNDIHSYRHLNLILSKAEISPAPPKENIIDLPGGDGSLDLTESFGEVKYGDRACTFTFTMNPAGDLSDSAFEDKKTEVSNALNGLACNITLDKDAGFYYKGRTTVSEYLSDRRLRQIVVTAIVRPYKLKNELTEVAAALTLTAQTLVLENGRKRVVPEITCTADAKVVFGSGTFNLSKGTHKILEICLTEGSNEVKVSGSGMVTFRYQEG